MIICCFGAKRNSRPFATILLRVFQAFFGSSFLLESETSLWPVALAMRKKRLGGWDVRAAFKPCNVGGLEGGFAASRICDRVRRVSGRENGRADLGWCAGRKAEVMAGHARPMNQTLVTLSSRLSLDKAEAAIAIEERPFTDADRRVNAQLAQASAEAAAAEAAFNAAAAQLTKIINGMADHSISDKFYY